MQRAGWMMAAALAVTAMCGMAQAQVRDAGSKARGDYNFYSPSMSNRMMMRSFTYSAPATEARRSFSYEPAAPSATVQSSAPAHASAPAPQAQTAQAPTATRRYSYEPGTVMMNRPMRSNVNAHSPRYLHADAKILGRFND